MSSFSDFRLKILKVSLKPHSTEKIADALRLLLWDGARTPEDFIEGEVVNWAWYKEEHEPAMRKLSKKFPDILFALEVYPEDEGLGVAYMKYFQGGKMQVVERPPFPPFNARKLK